MGHGNGIPSGKVGATGKKAENERRARLLENSICTHVRPMKCSTILMLSVTTLSLQTLEFEGAWLVSRDSSFSRILRWRKLFP